MEVEDRVLKLEAFVKDLDALMKKYGDIWVPGMVTTQYLLACYYSCRWEELIRIDDIAKEGARLALAEMNEKEKRTSI